MVFSQLSSVATVLSTATSHQSVAQSSPEEFSVVFFLFFAVVTYAFYVIFTLGLGALVLAVAADYVRAIERQLSQKPVRAGAVGVGAWVAAIVGYIFVVVVVLLSVELGAPEATVSVLIVVGFCGFILLTLMTLIGEIIAGSYVLARVQNEDEPNLWLALVVAAVGINLLYFIPPVSFVLGPLLIALATGAAIDRWWTSRRDDSSRPSYQPEDVNE